MARRSACRVPGANSVKSPLPPPDPLSLPWVSISRMPPRLMYRLSEVVQAAPGAAAAVAGVTGQYSIG